jgi:hypothetical protein
MVEAARAKAWAECPERWKYNAIDFKLGFEAGYAAALQRENAALIEQRDALARQMGAILDTLHRPNPNDLTVWHVAPGYSAHFSRAVEAATKIRIARAVLTGDRADANSEQQ